MDLHFRLVGSAGEPGLMRRRHQSQIHRAVGHLVALLVGYRSILTAVAAPSTMAEHPV